MTDSRSSIIRQHFRRQADSCQQIGSPFTARICRLTADRLTEDTRTGERVLSWPGDAKFDALGLRFAGALHALVLMGMDAGLAQVYPPDGIEVSDEDLWQAVINALKTHDDFIHDWLDSPPQTNEVARAAMIMPALMQLADTFRKPLALYEIGTSAGLTLQLAEFHYDYAGTQIGDAGSPVHLNPDVRTPPPLSGQMPDIISRRGCDLNPYDPENEADILRLRSYTWPDQPHRHDRINGAIELFRYDPPRIDRAEALEWVERQLQSLIPDAVNVFFHTIVWQYLPEETSDGIMQAFDRAGASAMRAAPLALVGMDAATQEYALLHSTAWIGDHEKDGETLELARVDYHGRWIDWAA